MGLQSMSLQRICIVHPSYQPPAYEHPGYAFTQRLQCYSNNYFSLHFVNFLEYAAQQALNYAQDINRSTLITFREFTITLYI